jgi:Family of unknown function (DUF6496)
MPEQETLKRAEQDKREGKSPSTQAGEFVREEMHHIREGKHGATSTKQVIAIGLSKARRAGVDLPPPAPGTVSEDVREKAIRDTQRGRAGKKPSPRRSRAGVKALQREGRAAASPAALARQAKEAARRRGPTARRRAAQKAVRTKCPSGRKRAAQKAARTRKRRAA